MENKKKNIIDDAETLKIKNNKIVEIGKKIKKIKDVQGQYMGIFMIPRNRRKEILKIIKENKMEKNHITYFLNFLIQKNEILKPKLYKGLWYEFDDKTDLNQFKKIIDEKIYWNYKKHSQFNKLKKTEKGLVFFSENSSYSKVFSPIIFDLISKGIKVTFISSTKMTLCLK